MMRASRHPLLALAAVALPTAPWLALRGFGLTAREFVLRPGTAEETYAADD